MARAADALVVGGGCIGLSVARALVLRGIERVMVIERGRLGAESSHAAGGMLAAQAEADGPDDFLELATASRDSYAQFATDLYEETGIDIELERTGTLYLAFTERDEAELLHRYHWQSRAGLAVEKLSRDEALRLEPALSPAVRLALRFPLDVQVENRRLIAALVASLEKHGVGLLTSTGVASLRIERGRVTGCETSRGFIAAPIVVVASGAWTSLIGMEDEQILQIEPVRGQMLCFEAQPPLARHVLYSPRGYLVPRMDGRTLAGSTTERVGFDRSVTGEGLHLISRHAIEIAPRVASLPLVDSWAGLRPSAPPDELPVLGSCAGAAGLYYATGHYRNGILLAPITGHLIAEEIVSGERPKMLAPFTPDRFRAARHRLIQRKISA